MDYEMDFIIMKRISNKIFLEGFESIGFSSDDLIYLFNNKHNIRVNKEDILNLRYLTDIDKLPISFDEKLLIKQEIYNQGIKYVDNSKEQTFKDFKKDTIVSLWLRHERKSKEKKKKDCVLNVENL